MNLYIIFCTQLHVSISFQGPSYLVLYRMLTLCTKVYLFVWVFRPTREFCSQIEMLPLQLRGSKFWHMRWEFFSVPNLQWHGASVDNDHLRRPETLTNVAELLAKELSVIGFTTCVCRSWGSNTQSPASEEKNRILQIFLVENKVLHTYLEKWHEHK